MGVTFIEGGLYERMHTLIPSPHLLVLATSERFLPAWDIFRTILADESH